MNDHFNDVKHRALLFQTGNLTGKLDDLEAEHVKNQIINLNPSGNINDLWMEYLDEVGITDGQYNDRITWWLKSQSHEGDDINQLWLSYYESLLP